MVSKASFSLSRLMARSNSFSWSLFKVSAGIVFILMINQITWLVDVISDIIGLAPTDYTLKLAVFHTIFNVAGVIIMIPLVNPLVRLVTRLMPEKIIAEAKPKYLNESAFELPDTALESVRKETVHLYENAFAIIAHGLSLHRHDILSYLNHYDNRHPL